MSQDVADVIIVGSAPAGYTAAVYTARAQLSPILFGVGQNEIGDESSRHGGEHVAAAEVPC